MKGCPGEGEGSDDSGGGAILEEGIRPAACLCRGGRWEEAAGVNGDAKSVEELQPCLLLGEEGYAGIVKFLTAKVMQGLRSIRLPVIIYREGKKKKNNTQRC